MGDRYLQHDAVLAPTPVNCFKEILSTIPRSQKRIGVDKWYGVLGKQCSTKITLPGNQVFSSHMKESLRHVNCKRLTLIKGVHQDLEDSFCMAHLDRRPNRLNELVPLNPKLEGYHNASRYMCRGSVLPLPTTVPWTLQPQPSDVKITPHPMGVHSIFLRTLFLNDVSMSMVSW